MRRVEVRQPKFCFDLIKGFRTGGGSEPEQYYTLWKHLHRQLDKHMVLQDSFRKFIEGREEEK